MNTIAFAEEVAVDEAEAVLETADVVAEDAADATLAEASLADASNPDRIIQGMTYTYDKDKGEYVPKTDISYATDPTDKKATVPNVATITDVDDPVSWNNVYGTGLIHSVIFGTNNEDTWLNNSSTATVSENYDPANPATVVGNYAAPKGYRISTANMSYGVVPIKEGDSYLFVAYGLVDDPSTAAVGYANWAFVEGYDDEEPTTTGRTYHKIVPVTEWDGRKIDFNKSGNYKWDAGKKEALDVKVALVKYSGGTLTEIPGAEASVKVDQKNQKAASVAAEYQFVQKQYAGTKLDNEGKTVPATYTDVITEYKKLSDLPFFTLSVKVKGKDAKTYNKDLKEVLKKEEYNKYYFGILPYTVGVDTFDFSTDFDGNGKGFTTEYDSEGYPAKYTVSDGNAKVVEKAIAEQLTNAQYADMDDDEQMADKLKVTNFKGKTAKITITGKTGERNLKRANNGYELNQDLVSLKAKKDFEFSAGKMASTDVSVLEFKGTNVIYEPLDKNCVIEYNDDGTVESVKKEYPSYTTGDFAQIGYKWAFRMSPVEKSKKFRRGIYHSDNIGFVYEAE